MLKKSFFSIAVSAMLMLSSCTSSTGLLGSILGGGLGGNTNTTSNVLGSVLGSVLGGMTSSGGGLLGGILGSALTDNSVTDLVLGGTRVNQSDLVGTWIYAQPGCAFTSQNLLAKAGGTAAATQIKQKLSSAYSSLGFANNNTGFAFDQNGNFEAVLKGLPLNGTYTLDPSSGKLNLKTSVGTISSYVARTSNGLSITMESKMLTSVLQALGNLSSNSSITSIANLGNQYNGVRMGFEVVKYQQK
ncbi:MAG: DUF4923 family protein [Muribaculaceae bacterium]|nr:DUF4923 family protein [Muribaculaceae bacterium]